MRVCVFVCVYVCVCARVCVLIRIPLQVTRFWWTAWSGSVQLSGYTDPLPLGLIWPSSNECSGFQNVYYSWYIIGSIYYILLHHPEWLRCHCLWRCTHVTTLTWQRPNWSKHCHCSCICVNMSHGSRVALCWYYFLHLICFRRCDSLFAIHYSIDKNISFTFLKSCEFELCFASDFFMSWWTAKIQKFKTHWLTKQTKSIFILSISICFHYTDINGFKLYTEKLLVIINVLFVCHTVAILTIYLRLNLTSKTNNLQYY